MKNPSDASGSVLHARMAPVHARLAFLTPKSGEAHLPDVAQLSSKYEILNFHSREGVNFLPHADLMVALPSDHLKVTQQGLPSAIKTTEDFFAWQMFKHVSIEAIRPESAHVRAEYFQPVTWYHGIMAGFVLEQGPFGDVATIKLRPYFWLLTLQNNYRSFEDLSVQEVLKQVFSPYQEKFSSGKFMVEFAFEQGEKRLQILQMGESDYTFVIRLLEESGLSYFFYYTEKNSVLVITDNLKSAYNRVSSTHFATLTKPIVYYNVLDGEMGTYPIEAATTPVSRYRMVYEPPTAQMKASTYHDWRYTSNISGSLVEQDSIPHQLTDGFKPERMFFLPFGQNAEATTEGRAIKLQKLAADRLGREGASKAVASMQTQSFGLVPIWRAAQLRVTSYTDDPRYAPEFKEYKTHFAQPKETYFIYVEHHFTKPHSTLISQSGGHSSTLPTRQGVGHFRVNLKLVADIDENFKLPFVDLHTHSTTETGLLRDRTLMYSAVVVDFKPDDKTEREADVPNMIRVRFPWHSDKESIKARASFFWAGKGYGSLFLPEIGSEVIVSFVDDNQDYPVIMGSLYNTLNPYPHDVATREADGKLYARGIVFKNHEASFVFETVKNPKDEKKTQVLTLAVPDGNVQIEAVNMNMTADDSFYLSSQSGKSTLTMNDASLKLDAFKSTVTLQGEGSVTLESNTLNVDTKGDTAFKASVITANSLKLPG